MKEIKINFVDFWPNFDKKNNYFYNLLIQKYKVIIDENPELLFYSSFGKRFLNYNCKRIFYTGENSRPDFLACDFAFSFDYNLRKNHFRLPLYSIYIDYHDMLQQLERIISKEEATKIWKSKTKFCCMIVSNPNCENRIKFFENLSKVKHVDSGGGVLNNIGGRVVDKLAFIKEYKFVISFENSNQDGYTTEKIMEPILQDCIPIYWGNKLIARDFNSKRFIDYNEFKSEKDLINRILEIDDNDELAIEMILQSTFNESKISHSVEHKQVLKRISKIIESTNKPIALSGFRFLYFIQLFCRNSRKKFLKFIELWKVIRLSHKQKF